jgi:hybrid cluster-associated redox disulfide protein
MNGPSICDPDLPISDVMTTWPETTPVFLRHRMLCVGCPIAPFHTVIDACAEHMVNEQQFRAELQDAISLARFP